MNEAAKWVLEIPTFYYDKNHDVNDGKEWSDMDVADLKAGLKHGHTIEEAASFLCRAGTPAEVRKKAKELGLTYTRILTGAGPRGGKSKPKPIKTAESAAPKMVRWKGRLRPGKVGS